MQHLQGSSRVHLTIKQFLTIYKEVMDNVFEKRYKTYVWKALFHNSQHNIISLPSTMNTALLIQTAQ